MSAAIRGDRTHRWRRARIALLTFAPVALAACSATYPTRPAATPSSLRLFHWGTTGYFRPSVQMPFTAYLIDSDGVYTDVSAAATWQSSSPGVVSVVATRLPQPSFSQVVTGIATAIAPGSARVSVSYQGLTDGETLTVGPFIRPLPYIEISLSGVFPISLDFPGGSSAYSVTYWGGAPSQNVSNLITVTSSDPSVARVEGGRIVPVAPGPFRIIASYEGVTQTELLSVQPLTRDVPRP